MASLWQKTLVYLGLVEEDQVDAAAGSAGDGSAEARAGDGATATVPSSSVVRARPPGAVSGRRVDPPAAHRRRISDDPAYAEAGVLVRDPETGEPLSGYGRVEPESQVIVARNFSDAQTLADSIRANRPVILDLRSTEPEMVRRLVDFASGLTYALDGKMVKTAQGVILVSPPGVTVGVDEQERLAALGLYSVPIDR